MHRFWDEQPTQDLNCCTTGTLPQKRRTYTGLILIHSFYVQHEKDGRREARLASLSKQGLPSLEQNRRHCSQSIRTNVTVTTFRLFLFIDRVRTSLLRSVKGKGDTFITLEAVTFCSRSGCGENFYLRGCDIGSFLVYLCKEFTKGDVCV